MLLSPGSSKLKLLYTIGSLNTTVELSLHRQEYDVVPAIQESSSGSRVHPWMELFWIVLDVSRKSKAYTISDCVPKFKSKSAMPNCLFILIIITPQHTKKGTRIENVSCARECIDGRHALTSTVSMRDAACSLGRLLSDLPLCCLGRYIYNLLLVPWAGSLMICCLFLG